MTVSAGTGGASVGGVILGGGAVSEGAGKTDVLTSLPFTGATHLMLLVALAIVLLVVGCLAVGLVRTHRLPGGPLSIE